MFVYTDKEHVKNSKIYNLKTKKYQNKFAINKKTVIFLMDSKLMKSITKLLKATLFTIHYLRYYIIMVIMIILFKLNCIFIIFIFTIKKIAKIMP